MRGAAVESIALLVLGVLLPALGFRAEARERTLVPLALNDEVVAKELRHEKKPGVDDACRLTLRSLEDGEIRVQRLECPLFEGIEVGALLEKSAGEDRLRVDDGERELSASRDSHGAAVVLGTAFAPLLLALVWARRRSQE